MSNKKKSEFLGMPHGTAQGRLRKMILFRLVQDACKDVCFRCGETIGTVEELSIEHKEPWLDRSVQRFWDLDNIAFSHLRCNRPHHIPHKKNYPEGKAWCKHCKQMKLIGNFPACKINDRSKLCTACHTIQARRWRNNKPAGPILS